MNKSLLLILIAILFYCCKTDEIILNSADAYFPAAEIKTVIISQQGNLYIFEPVLSNNTVKILIKEENLDLTKPLDIIVKTDLSEYHNKQYIIINGEKPNEYIINLNTFQRVY
jgi:hypothetical protein